MSSPKPEKSSNRILTPIRKRSTMTRYKNALDFEQDDAGDHHCISRGNRGAIETTSRLRRRAVTKKGTFQKKAKTHDAPNLVTVITAKPEVKKRATDVAMDREKKREEKKKQAGRITVRKKDAMKLKKDAWTNVLNPSKPPETKPKMRGTKASCNAAADWKKAYENVFSPRSGKPKVVAKQDLISENKILSPKKKKRSSTSSKKAKTKKHVIPKLPDIPLDDVDDDEMEDPIPRPPLEAESSPSSSRRSSKKQPVLIEPDSPEPSPPPRKKVTKPSVPMEEEKEESRPPPPATVVPKSEEKMKVDDVEDGYQDYDEFEDFDSQAGSEGTPLEMESDHPNSDRKMEVDVDSEQQQQKQQQPVIKQQLVLEFALPKEDGAEDDGAPGLEVPVELESMDEISSVGSWPSIESDDSYDTRLHKMMQRWVDVDGAYDDIDENNESGTVYDNDVDLEDNVLDHIVLAAPDLDEAIVQFEEMTGIRPTPVGPLQGLGAKTAHIGLDENRYIEILAPDDDNPGPIGDDLKKLSPGTLTPFHYAIRSSEVTRLIEGYVYDVLGWDPDHIAMVQALPDNSLRSWDLLCCYGHNTSGGIVPCYVKWKDHSQHPTAKIALKADLLTCTVRAPAGHDVHKLITGVGGVNVEHGQPLLECVLATPKGRLTFSADNPVGLVFPGYEEEHLISELPDMPDMGGDQESYDEDWADVGTQSESS